MSISLRSAVRAARPAFRTIAPAPVAASARTLTTFTTARPSPLAAPARPILAATMATTAHADPAVNTAPQVKAGDAVPSIAVRTKDPQTTVDFSTLKGKNILVTVPGAFTPGCNSQMPGYIENYDKFKAKGINDIYVVSVNDIFVVNAWKNHLIGDKDTVKFAGDDKGELSRALGLVLDAKGLGGKRFHRSAIVIEDGKVVDAFVEPVSGKLTVSHADEVLKTL